MLHGLALRDAALIGLQYMERVYPEEPKRIAAWRRLAKALGLEAVEDEKLRAERLRREHAKVAAEFGGDE